MLSLLGRSPALQVETCLIHKQIDGVNVEAAVALRLTIRGFEDHGLGVLDPRSQNVNPAASLRTHKVRGVAGWRSRMAQPDGAAGWRSRMALPDGVDDSAQLTDAPG